MGIARLAEAFSKDFLDQALDRRKMGTAQPYRRAVQWDLVDVAAYFPSEQCFHRCCLICAVISLVDQCGPVHILQKGITLVTRRDDQRYGLFGIPLRKFVDFFRVPARFFSGFG